MATHPGGLWRCWLWGAPLAWVLRCPPGPAGAQALGLFLMSSTSASTISLTSSCKEGERQMRAAAQGTNGQHVRSIPEHDEPSWRPTAGQGGDAALRGSSRSSSGPSPSVCVGCTAAHWGCPSLPWWLLSSKQEPARGHRNWDFSVCPSHPTQRFPPPSPSLDFLLEDMNTWKVPLTSNVTLGFQFSFCLALVQSPCRKSCGKEERSAA